MSKPHRPDTPDTRGAGTAAHDASLDALHGLRVLVLEDEYLMAEDIRLQLHDAGADVVGPTGRIADALYIIEGGVSLDAAVLDVNLGEDTAFPAADALRERGVPFVFCTGYGAHVLPEPYRDVPVCDKPVDVARLARMLFH